MSDINDIFGRATSGGGHEDQWISLSDLMTGLMMIFMLIAIAFMLKIEADSAQGRSNSQQAQAQAQQVQAEAEQVERDAEKIKQVAVVYDQAKNDLYESLNNEFKGDLPSWGATINKDLSIRFSNEEVLFDRGQDVVKPSFKTILQNFFPRYLKIITSDKYKSGILEVRIEGHTSSMWSTGVSDDEAYFKNMELSQSRTRSTLRYLLELPEAQKQSAWLRKYLTANGLSSSHLILNPDGTENPLLSQRVEFRIRTDAESKINDILQSAK